VILPLAFPAVVAGSIFTFSLTLGDYLAPKLVSNEQFIGTAIFDSITNNQPFAAALALVPIVVVIAYLGVARKLGAFEHV
jgi:putative spermidine/putrescine transport system permease protein